MPIVSLTVALRAAAVFAAAAATACASDVSAVGAGFLYERHQIILPVSIGGSGPHHVLLDTGVYPSVVDSSLAAELRLPVDFARAGEAAGAGDGRGLTVSPALITDLEIAGAPFGDVGAVAADLGAFGQALDVPLAGILGYSFLAGRVVRIDYAARRVDIAESRAALPPLPRPVTARHEIALEWLSEDDQMPRMDISVNGEIMPASIDTGSSLGVELFPAAVERLGLETERDAGGVARVLGARGLAEMRTGVLERVEIGPIALEDVDVRFSDRDHDPAERMANVGNRLLGRLVVTLDYVDGAVVFEQTEPPS